MSPQSIMGASEKARGLTGPVFTGFEVLFVKFFNLSQTCDF